MSPVFAKLTAAWMSAADPLRAPITAALAEVLKPPSTRAIPNIQERAGLLRLTVLCTLCPTTAAPAHPTLVCFGNRIEDIRRVEPRLLILVLISQAVIRSAGKARSRSIRRHSDESQRA